MLSKKVSIILCGFIVGLIGLRVISSLPRNDPAWVSQLEELGLVDQLGHSKADTKLLVVTSYECYSCMELMALVWPSIRESLYRGEASLQVVNIFPNTNANRNILEAKKVVSNLDSDLMIVLTEYVINNYRHIYSNNLDAVQILNEIGLNINLEGTDINWNERIESSFPILEEAGLSVVPLWFVNLKRVRGTPDQIVDEIEKAVKSNWSPAV